MGGISVSWGAGWEASCAAGPLQKRTRSFRERNFNVWLGAAKHGKVKLTDLKKNGRKRREEREPMEKPCWVTPPHQSKKKSKP